MSPSEDAGRVSGSVGSLSGAAAGLCGVGSLGRVHLSLSNFRISVASRKVSRSMEKPRSDEVSKITDT